MRGNRIIDSELASVTDLLYGESWRQLTPRFWLSLTETYAGLAEAGDNALLTGFALETYDLGHNPQNSLIVELASPPSDAIAGKSV